MRRAGRGDIAHPAPKIDLVTRLKTELVGAKVVGLTYRHAVRDRVADVIRAGWQGVRWPHRAMRRLLVRGDLAAHVDRRRQPRHRPRGESARAIHRRQRRRDVLIAGPHLRFQRVKTIVLKGAPPRSARPQIGWIRRKPLRLAGRRPLAGRLGDLAPGAGRLLEGQGRLDDWRLILRREIAAAQTKAQSKPQHP